MNSKVTIEVDLKHVAIVRRAGCSQILWGDQAASVQ
jgi:hypothetical protein